MNLQINMAVCRVCMKRQDEPGVSVFANSALLKKFILMTDLEISQNDNLPSDICHRCVTRLNVAFEFRKQARASDTHFRKFIEKVNQQFSQLAVSPSHTEKGADDDFDPDVEYLIEAEEVEPETATVIPVQSFTVSSPEPSEETKRDLERPQKRAKMEVIDNIDIVELEYQGTEEVVSDFADNEQSVVVERSKAEEPHIVKVPAEKRAVKRETVSENVCGKCNKSFSTRTNLIRHLSSHDMEMIQLPPDMTVKSFVKTQNEKGCQPPAPKLRKVALNESTTSQQEAPERVTLVKIFKMEQRILKAVHRLREDFMPYLKATCVNPEKAEEEQDYRSSLPFTFPLMSISAVEACEEYLYSSPENLKELAKFVKSEVPETEGKDYSREVLRYIFTDNVFHQFCWSSISEKTFNRIRSDNMALFTDFMQDGNRPYVCSTCGKGFTQNGSLKQHMFLHTGERPFKCSVCDRSFTQAKTLTFHMRRHTGEKPFTCSHCNANFRQRDGLKRHILVKHNMILKEIHECEICRKELPSRTALLMHSKRHTDNDDPITTVTKTADDGSIFYTVVEVPEEK